MNEPTPTVELHHGDAVYHTSGSGRQHPLNPNAPSSPFEAVIALDCAYHFKTRRLFLGQCFNRLSPGGRIGLADICFDFTSTIGWRSYVVSFMGLMPRANVVRPAEYVQMMQDLGFEDVELEDITANVFPGFFAFLRSQGSLWPFFVATMSVLVRCGMRFVIVSARTPL
jgi:hypothetical protein